MTSNIITSMECNVLYYINQPLLRAPTFPALRLIMLDLTGLATLSVELTSDVIFLLVSRELLVSVNNPPNVEIPPVISLWFDSTRRVDADISLEPISFKSPVVFDKDTLIEFVTPGLVPVISIFEVFDSGIVVLINDELLCLLLFLDSCDLCLFCIIPLNTPCIGLPVVDLLVIAVTVGIVFATGTVCLYFNVVVSIPV